MSQPLRKHIVLTGFMAVGKSVVGHRLAARVKRSFVDLDEVIESREGMKVREIFAAKGEPYFRKMEKELLRETLRGDGKVIATGGGTIIDQENLCLLKETCVLISLTAAPENILIRAAVGGTNRPLLEEGDKLTTIKELMAQRDEAYRQAHIRVDTDGRSVDEVVEEIMQLLGKGEQ